MNKFYLLIFFICFTFFANAQAGKRSDSNFPPADGQVKMVRLYPNPATTVINFEVPKSTDKIFTLTVYNFVGKKIYEQNAGSQKIIIPLNDFYRGVYIFQLRDQTGRVIESGKFQVNK
jgi:hypothetical protein